ncbi:DUF3168 domain-containing protein [Streptomyces sp. R302]|nr:MULTISPECIES: DUF3168 domain-containing protein [unclassified Streptomyces]NML55663.1 DUF3168 domain-containing protein [Streptomyces sp. R301]NML83995.1 DUF3168 domain-containing protein [Streptomyces sp. R302]
MLAVQGAVYTKLSADGELTVDLGAGVYDNVPENAPFPHIVLGEATEVPANSQDRFARDTVVTLHVWTKALGHTEGLTIGQRVNALLDHQPLTIPGLDHVATLFEFGQTLTDPEPPGDIRHLMLRYRVRTEQRPA